MLEPNDRELLFDDLRPPADYAFDQAIVTTYSLDLVSLLTAPLAFSFFDYETFDGETIVDPIPLLEAVRRHGSRMSVFCNAGRITLPGKSGPLFTFIEDSVYECLPLDETASFHPKVWILRYISDRYHVRYRVLVLSRNMTSDRSWDVSLRLDGDVLQRARGFSQNAPLAEFVAALPIFSRRPLPQDRLAAVTAVADELEKVKWEDVEGFYPGVKFWPMGVPHRRRSSPLRGRVDRLLVVSPFIEPSFWSANSQISASTEAVLVSRPESIDRLSKEHATRFAERLVLREEAMQEGTGDAVNPELDSSLKGLHAKVFVAEAGWVARWWVGSANATGAAFRRNVEFLVELEGSKAKVGIDRLLAQGPDQLTLGSLLGAYEGVGQSDGESDEEAAADLAEEARSIIARATLVAGVSPPTDDGRYTLKLEPGGLVLPNGVSASVRPLTLNPEDRKSLDGGPVSFGPITMGAITPFLVFELTAAVGAFSKRLSFVRRVELSGGPEGRTDEALRTMLSSQQDVLRYLLFLLQSQGGEGYANASAALLMDSGGPGHWMAREDSLLESMARMLVQDPRRLDQVHRLVSSLSKQNERDDLFPAHFRDVWEPIWAARQAIVEGAS